MKKYKSFLFDADGTLINTGRLIIECYRYTFEHFGYPVQSAENILEYMGIPFVNQLQKYLGVLSEEKLIEISEFYKKHQNDISSEYLKLFDGAEETLSELKSRGASLAVVTSRKRESLYNYFKKLEIYEYFDVFVTPEDVDNPKPHKEPCEYAIKKLNSNSDETIFIGDALFDHQSARGCGVDFAYVNWSHIPFEKFTPAPEHKLEKMQDLLSL